MDGTGQHNITEIFMYLKTSFPGSYLFLPGCGWSRAYLYKSNPHRGWVFDLILSTLSMEVTVALPLCLKVKQVICQ